MRRRLLPAGLVALGFALRTHRLGQADIWWDEGLAVWAVRKSLAEATAWTAGDVHPPLFFWTLWPWIRLAGDGEFAVRLLPALTGTLLLAVTFALAARVGGRRAGLIALALAATSRFLVWWSMELRMYALAALCLALAAYAAARWWAAWSAMSASSPSITAKAATNATAGKAESSATAGKAVVTVTAGVSTAAATSGVSTGSAPAGASPGTAAARSAGAPWLALYSVAALGTLMSVYLAGLGLLLVAVPPIVALARRRAWRPATAWLGAQVIALVAFAPWAWYAAERMPSWRIVEAPPRLAFVAELWATLLAAGISTELAEARAVTISYWLAAAAALAAIAATRAVASFRETTAAPAIAATRAVASTRETTATPAIAATRAVASIRETTAPPALAATRTTAATFSTAATPLVILVAFLLATPLLVWAITQPRSIFYSPRVEARYFVPFAAPVYALLGVVIARGSLALSRVSTRRSPALGHTPSGSIGPALDRSPADSPTLARSPAFTRFVAPALVLALVVAAPALGLSSLPGHYAHRHRTADLPAMAVAIWSQAEAGDVVLLVSGNRYPLFRYHYGRRWVRPFGVPEVEWPADRPAGRDDLPEVVPFPDRGSLTLADRPGWEERLERIVSEHARIWLVEYGRDLQDPGDEVEAWLADRLPRVLSEGYGPDALHLFAADGRPPRLVRASSRWPGTIVVEDVERTLLAPGPWLPLVGLPARRAAPGQAFELALFAQDSEAVIPLAPWLAIDPAPREHRAVRRGAAAAAPEVGSGTPARIRMRVPVDDRTPGGAARLLARSLDERTPDLMGHGIRVEVVGAAPLVDVHRSRHGLGQVGDYLLASAAFSPPSLGPGGTVVLDLVWRNPTDVESREHGTAGGPYPGPGLGTDVRPDSEVGHRAAADLGGPDVESRAPADVDPAAAPIVFAHLVGPPRPGTGDPVWAIQDGPPSSGHWGRGPGSAADIFDRHVLRLDPAAPPGEYTLEVGLYDPISGERLPVSGDTVGVDAAASRIVVGVVPVRR